MPFKTLRLIPPLLNAVHSEGYTIPTAIQQQAIPHVLDGKDLLGCAQTGTGKTAAFALPILQRLHGPVAETDSDNQDATRRPKKKVIRCLVLTPTRELAAQIGDSFFAYGRNTSLRHAVIFGGVKQSQQVKVLRKGVDILVATPGRLLDLINQDLISLDDIEIFVLDEADRMLDMGFIHDIRKVTSLLPDRRQTLLFSATMPREIRALADSLLEQPVKVTVAAESPAADTVQQALYYIPTRGKTELLLRLLQNPQMDRTLVFTRTKRGADRVVKHLQRSEVVAEAIHSNKSQNARIRTLDNFKQGRTRVLVATDIAARGLDVDNISHVINYDMPNEAETYVHRIGRTGRAGARGRAVSFCSEEERGELRDIERLLGRSIVVESHSIQVAPLPAGQENTTRSKPAARASRKSPLPQLRSEKAPQARRAAKATPEGQKAEFWRRRRKPRKTVAVGARRSGHSG